MRWNNLLKPKIYVGIIISLFLVLGVYLWAAYQQNQTDRSVEGNHDPHETQGFAGFQDLSPIPKALKREWAAKHKVIRAKIEAEVERKHLEEMPQMVADFLAESYPDTEAARAIRAEMLAALKPIDEKSESEIIQTVMDFFPENVLAISNQDNSLTAYFTNAYQWFRGEYEKPEAVLSLVYEAEVNLTGLIQAAEKSERANELRQTDPDAYYTLEIEETLADISETEAEIRNHEAQGKTEWAASSRRSLASLNTYLSGLRRDQAFAADHAKWKAERAAAADDDLEIAGGIERITELSEWIKQRMAELQAEEEAGIAEPAPGAPVLSEGPVPAGSAYDPVRSYSTTQASLVPWRSDLDKDYLDVFVSRSMSDEELNHHFSTQADRDQTTNNLYFTGRYPFWVSAFFLCNRCVSVVICKPALP